MYCILYLWGCYCHQIKVDVCSRGKNVFFYIQLDKVWARIWRIDKKPGSGSRIEKKLDPETHITASNSTVLWRTYSQHSTVHPRRRRGWRGSMTYLVGPQELSSPLCQLSPTSGRRTSGPAGGEKQQLINSSAWPTSVLELLRTDFRTATPKANISSSDSSGLTLEL